MIEEISHLIQSRREGDYWDFKEQHHQNKAALLHDIICLANAVTKTEKYLIYGVADPSNGCEVVGVSDDNRRNQSGLIDFLRSKDFAGDIRPEVEVRTLNIEGAEIDVIVIFDHPEKPYYLTSEYRDNEKFVRANHIYTRVRDTNTPIDSSADLRFIEAMWRERFGLDAPPAETMVELLAKPSEWDKDIGNKKTAYHVVRPEYQIIFSETEEFRDVYSYFYINNRSFHGMASFQYLSTELFTLPYMYCDEMRIDLVPPSNGRIDVNGRAIWYMYYELSSRAGAFLRFMTDGSLNFGSRGSQAAFLIFRDSRERAEFETFVADNVDRLEAIADSDVGQAVQDQLDREEEGFVFRPVEMMKISTLLEIWRTEHGAT